MIMPLRGLLFRKLKKVQADRHRTETERLRDEFKKKSVALTKLRKTRIESEARAELRRHLTEEEARIKAAKGPSRISRLEKLFEKQTKKAVRAPITKQLAKRAIKELGLAPKKKPGKKRKRLRRRKRRK